MDSPPSPAVMPWFELLTFVLSKSVPLEGEDADVDPLVGINPAMLSSLKLLPRRFDAVVWEFDDGAKSREMLSDKAHLSWRLMVENAPRRSLRLCS
jgi:hypothetical protein